MSIDKKWIKHWANMILKESYDDYDYEPRNDWRDDDDDYPYEGYDEIEDLEDKLRKAK